MTKILESFLFVVLGIISCIRITFLNQTFRLELIFITLSDVVLIY
jgi:hypothetical protein